MLCVVVVLVVLVVVLLVWVELCGEVVCIIDGDIIDVLVDK